MVELVHGQVLVVQEVLGLLLVRVVVRLVAIAAGVEPLLRMLRIIPKMEATVLARYLFLLREEVLVRLLLQQVRQEPLVVHLVLLVIMVAEVVEAEVVQVMVMEVMVVMLVMLVQVVAEVAELTALVVQVGTEVMGPLEACIQPHLLSLSMLERLVVKAVEVAVAVVLLPILMVLRVPLEVVVQEFLLTVLVTVQEVQELMLPPGVVRLEVQAATAATAEEQQDCV